MRFLVAIRDRPAAGPTATGKHEIGTLVAGLRTGQLPKPVGEVIDQTGKLCGDESRHNRVRLPGGYCCQMVSAQWLCIDIQEPSE